MSYSNDWDIAETSLLTNLKDTYRVNDRSILREVACPRIWDQTPPTTNGDKITIYKNSIPFKNSDLAKQYTYYDIPKFYINNKNFCAFGDITQKETQDAYNYTSKNALDFTNGNILKNPRNWLYGYFPVLLWDNLTQYSPYNNFSYTSAQTLKVFNLDSSGREKDIKFYIKDTMKGVYELKEDYFKIKSVDTNVTNRSFNTGFSRSIDIHETNIQSIYYNNYWYKSDFSKPTINSDIIRYEYIFYTDTPKFSWNKLFGNDFTNTALELYQKKFMKVEEGGEIYHIGQSGPYKNGVLSIQFSGTASDYNYFRCSTWHDSIPKAVGLYQNWTNYTASNYLLLFGDGDSGHLSYYFNPREFIYSTKYYQGDEINTPVQGSTTIGQSLFFVCPKYFLFGSQNSDYYSGNSNHFSTSSKRLLYDAELVDGNEWAKDYYLSDEGEWDTIYSDDEYVTEEAKKYSKDLYNDIKYIDWEPQGILSSKTYNNLKKEEYTDFYTGGPWITTPQQRNYVSSTSNGETIIKYFTESTSPTKETFSTTITKWSKSIYIVPGPLTVYKNSDNEISYNSFTSITDGYLLQTLNIPFPYENESEIYINPFGHITQNKTLNKTYTKDKVIYNLAWSGRPYYQQFKNDGDYKKYNLDAQIYNGLLPSKWYVNNSSPDVIWPDNSRFLGIMTNANRLVGMDFSLKLGSKGGIESDDGIETDDVPQRSAVIGFSTEPIWFEIDNNGNLKLNSVDNDNVLNENIKIELPIALCETGIRYFDFTLNDTSQEKRGSDKNGWTFPGRLIWDPTTRQIDYYDSGRTKHKFSTIYGEPNKNNDKNYINIIGFTNMRGISYIYPKLETNNTWKYYTSTPNNFIKEYLYNIWIPEDVTPGYYANGGGKVDENVSEIAIANKFAITNSQIKNVENGKSIPYKINDLKCNLTVGSETEILDVKNIGNGQVIYNKDIVLTAHKYENETQIIGNYTEVPDNEIYSTTYYGNPCKAINYSGNHMKCTIVGKDQTVEFNANISFPYFIVYSWDDEESDRGETYYLDITVEDNKIYFEGRVYWYDGGYDDTNPWTDFTVSNITISSSFTLSDAIITLPDYKSTTRIRALLTDQNNKHYFVRTNNANSNIPESFYIPNELMYEGTRIVHYNDRTCKIINYLAGHLECTIQGDRTFLTINKDIENGEEIFREEYQTTSHSIVNTVTVWKDNTTTYFCGERFVDGSQTIYFWDDFEISNMYVSLKQTITNPEIHQITQYGQKKYYINHRVTKIISGSVTDDTTGITVNIPNDNLPTGVIVRRKYYDDYYEEYYVDIYVSNDVTYFEGWVYSDDTGVTNSWNDFSISISQINILDVTII